MDLAGMGTLSLKNQPCLCRHEACVFSEEGDKLSSGLSNDGEVICKNWKIHVRKHGEKVDRDPERPLWGALIRE